MPTSAPAEAPLRATGRTRQPSAARGDALARRVMAFFGCERAVRNSDDDHSHGSWRRASARNLNWPASPPRGLLVRGLEFERDPQLCPVRLDLAFADLQVLFDHLGHSKIA